MWLSLQKNSIEDLSSTILSEVSDFLNSDYYTVMLDLVEFKYERMLNSIGKEESVNIADFFNKRNPKRISICALLLLHTALYRAGDDFVTELYKWISKTSIVCGNVEKIGYALWRLPYEILERFFKEMSIRGEIKIISSVLKLFECDFSPTYRSRIYQVLAENKASIEQAIEREKNRSFSELVIYNNDLTVIFKKIERVSLDDKNEEDKLKISCPALENANLTIEKKNKFTSICLRLQKNLGIYLKEFTEILSNSDSLTNLAARLSEFFEKLLSNPDHLYTTFEGALRLYYWFNQTDSSDFLSNLVKNNYEKKDARQIFYIIDQKLPALEIVTLIWSQGIFFSATTQSLVLSVELVRSFMQFCRDHGKKDLKKKCHKLRTTYQDVDIMPSLLAEMLFAKNFDDVLNQYRAFVGKMHNPPNTQSLDLLLFCSAQLTNTFQILGQLTFNYLSLLIGRSYMEVARFLKDVLIVPSDVARSLRPLFDGYFSARKNRNDELLGTLIGFLPVLSEKTFNTVSATEFKTLCSNLVESNSLDDILTVLQKAMYLYFTNDLELHHFHVEKEKLSKLKIVMLIATLSRMDMNDKSTYGPMLKKMLIEDMFGNKVFYDLISFKAPERYAEDNFERVAYHNNKISELLKVKGISLKQVIDYPPSEPFEMSREVGTQKFFPKAPKRFQVVNWDKNRADTFLLGNYLSCCLATNGTQFQAMIQRRIDAGMFFHVVMDLDKNEPVCGAWLYFGESEGDIYVVANFLELRDHYAMRPQLTEKLVSKLLEYTEKIHPRDWGKGIFDS